MAAPRKASVERLLDLAVAVAGLLLSAPLDLVVAVAVKLDSPGPVLHRARRVGRDGRPFTLYKFRSMAVGSVDVGPGVTARDDNRVTGVGRILRAWKIDEIPQLVNVVRGDMSLVGPRPEDPRYVRDYTEEQRRILRWRPGLTSPASLAYRHEESVLGAASDPEAMYRSVVLPDKLRIDLAYFEQATVLSDLRVLWQTARAVVSRAPVSDA